MRTEYDTIFLGCSCYALGCAAQRPADSLADAGGVQAVFFHEGGGRTALAEGVLDGHGLHGHRAAPDHHLRHGAVEPGADLVLLGGDDAAALLGGG